MPTPVLALVYWLHLLATSVWIGGMAILSLVVWPGLIKASGGGPDAQPVMDEIERRFRPLANISLIVLLTTGLIQMGGDSHYSGFLVINSLWTTGLLVKHLVIGVMIVITLIMQGQTLPALDRARLLAQRGIAGGAQQEAALRQRLRLLTGANLALGAAVLLVTAIITAL